MIEPVNIDLNAVCKRVLLRHKSEIEQLNKLQLLSGRRSEGRLPPYKKSYLKTRRKYGRPTAPMDLYLTGKLHSEIYSLFFQNQFELGSKDPKARFLEERKDIGSEAFGLDGQSRDLLLWEYGVADEIVAEIRNEILR